MGYYRSQQIKGPVLLWGQTSWYIQSYIQLLWSQSYIQLLWSPSLFASGEIYLYVFKLTDIVMLHHFQTHCLVVAMDQCHHFLGNNRNANKIDLCFVILTERYVGIMEMDPNLKTTLFLNKRISPLLILKVTHHSGILRPSEIIVLVYYLLCSILSENALCIILYHNSPFI